MAARESSPPTSTRRDLGRGAWIEYVDRFVDEHERAMVELVAALPLRQEPLTIFGRPRLTPRLTCWVGDADALYRYSGRVFEPQPWPPELAAMRDRLVEAAGVRFNSVLVNYYRDGSDSMGAHRDDEPELGPSPDDVRIASVSLGATRRFVLRDSQGGPRLEFALGGGDLLVMGGTTQRYFKHAVPKTRRPVGPRMNLTFRVIVAGRSS